MLYTFTDALTFPEKQQSAIKRSLGFPALPLTNLIKRSFQMGRGMKTLLKEEGKSSFCHKKINEKKFRALKFASGATYWPCN